VPKAAVHEQREACCSKYEIWLANQWLISSPAGDSVSPE